ncbi:unnamed protein product [Mytilus edulis]|uniref:Uncharacterized protein n=1 Tax=Mytilus edulis TaxID=6550 RepID=A0A8S3QGU7_MYTED|nr:unnamed protein product [Mytilus edulis]
MSDIEPDNLLNDIQPEVASHAAVPDEEISNADLLSLMQNYFDILDNISGALDNLHHKRYSKAVSLLEESEKVLKKRNKLIRIADKSEAGWKTVDEYLSDEVASNSEDEKKIRAAETRAVKKMKVTKRGTVTSQLPEDLLHKRNSDILQKIFSTGFWSENEKVAHPELRLLLHNLPTTVTDARAKSTVDKYSGGFKRFAKWTEKYREITCILPCKEIYVGLYLQNLIESANHFSLIESAFYSIRWAHNLAGVKNPCDSDLISSIVESARRTLSRPIKKKEPVTPDIMIKLFARYNTSNSTLKDLRLLTICSLAYTVFYVLMNYVTLKPNI